MSEMITGSLVGACAGAAVIALMWDEEWTLKNIIKYMVASISIAFAIYVAR
ncbi:hypothetical protein ACIQCX_13610 [Enterobacter cancerogenus]|uniref:hypothetical protein n=1 Tax=Enterobacter cancerogenus TaxID=69218 RepID=UPI003826B169